MATFALKDHSGQNKFNLILKIDIDTTLKTKELENFYLKIFEMLGLPLVAIMFAGESIPEIIEEHTSFCKKIDKIFDREAEKLIAEQEKKTLH